MGFRILFLVVAFCVVSIYCSVHPQQLTDEEKATWVAQFFIEKPNHSFGAKLYDVASYVLQTYGLNESQFAAGAVVAMIESDAGKDIGKILLQKFNEAYNTSNLSTWNSTYLMQNVDNASMLIYDHFDVFGTAQEIFRHSKTPWVADYIPTLKNAVEMFGEKEAQTLLGDTLKAMESNDSNAVQNLLFSILSNTLNSSSNVQNSGFGNFSILGNIREVLRKVSVRMALPFTQSSMVNRDCYEDSMDVLDSIKEMDKYPWARNIFDATGKLPSGVLKGRMSMLGSYDECIENNVNISANIVLGGIAKTFPRYPRSFKTKYCRATLTVPASVLGNIDTKGVNPVATLGLCMPSTCHSKDVKNMLQLGYLRSLTNIAIMDDVNLYCVEDRKVTDDSSAVVAITIVSFFVFFAFFGTILTMYNSWKTKSLQHNAKQNGSMSKSSRENIYTVLSEKQQNATLNGDTHHYSALNDIQGKHIKQNGITNGKVKNEDLPTGYMHHKEADFYAPGAGKYKSENSNEEGKGDTVTTHRSLPEVQVDIVERDDREKQVVQTTTPQSQRRHGPVYNFFACFSAEVHAPKILSGKSGGGAITCLHGIRFFSITWIMLGHTYNYGLITNPGVFTIENFVDAIPMIQRFTYQGVVGAGFSVDTFYMISGMLLSYIQIKQMFKLKQNPKPANVGYYVFYYYFHRFWRLTPMYMAVLMIFAGLFPYLGNGPMWPEGTGPAENCRKNWWTNLLYVNNLVEVDGMCMGWSWFLANDMQFYVVSIVLLFFLTLNLAFGSIMIFLLLAAGVASAGWKEYIYNGNFFTMKSDDGAFWNNVYITPWCRVAAFCVGMLLGVIMYRKPKYSMSRVKACIGWCIAVALGLGLVYCTYSENKKDGEPWSRNFRAAYESLGRPLWAACVAWVVFACHHGYGGIVNSLLSWKGLVPLSRLSYAAYLVHPILMMVHVFSKRNLVYLNDYEIIYLFLGHTVLTFMAAFVVSLLFEAPFMALEKLIIGKRR